MSYVNAAVEAVDKNAANWRKNKIAIYWESENGEKKKYTYLELSILSNKFANLLKEKGINRGDRVFFFLPRVPEIFYGFLGTLKRGAIAGTMFSAFGPQALEDRLGNSDASFVLTTEELKPRIMSVKKNLPNLKTIMTIESPEFQKLMATTPDFYHIAQTHQEDPAFMLYTSGTTGKPKGVVHVHKAIYHEKKTAQLVLDLKEEDIYWCTADPGWVTGIAYELLGTLAAGASTLVYAGRFDIDRWYKLMQDYKVTVWYTAPTAIRMMAAAGVEKVRKYDLSSLRHMASVGEPLNPEPIRWGKKAFGLYFHDTYWQTETGGMMITNRPDVKIKIGSMGKPIPGIHAGIVDDNGREVPTKKIGNIAFKKGWDSMMRKIWRRPNKYQSYFKNGWYLTGDTGFKDSDGYFWFVGRADDVIKTSGERVGPFEVESALVDHPSVVEAGVIGKPDAVRGEIIKAFVVLQKGVKPTDALKDELSQFVKKHLAGHAYPKEIDFIDKLPKTRSGKIMRRILKAKELGLPIGDTSTLEEY